MRPAIVALAALALLAGGCGSGRFASPVGDDEDDATTATTTSAATPPATAVGPRHSLVVAAEVAAAVNLRPSDFPYLSEQEESGDSEGEKDSHEFAKCFHRLQPEPFMGTSSSPQLGGPLGAEVMFFSSTVEVFRRAAGANQVIDALRDRRVFDCFARQLRPTIEDEQAGGETEILRIRVSRLDLAIPGVEKSFSFRITATVAPAPENRQLTAYALGTTPDGRPRANIYVDLIFFASDRIAVLMMAGGGPSPVPASIERNTLRLLRERAEGEAGRLLP